MNQVGFNIVDFFKKVKKMCFLVGAGCSVDVPSCLPTGYDMIEEIIKYTCPDSEISTILGLNELRFEALIEILRDVLDNKLKIIDYYEQSDNPNQQHFFLANMIKKGHLVITTNFDFLIEYALLQSNVPKEQIVPVITRNDFERFSNHNELYKQKKKVLYKIHGSTKNIITEESTKNSLIATIQAFGSNKEGLNVFQIEPFKRALFDHISKGYSLVIIGYSGSDDFDIIPTLKAIKNLENIIWIYHVPNDGGKEYVEEININTSRKYESVNNILLELKNKNPLTNIYRIDVNTSRLVNKLLDEKPKIKKKNTLKSIKDWMKINIKLPDQIKKYNMACMIYFMLNRYDDVERCSEEIRRRAVKTGDKFWIANALEIIGKINYIRGNYEKAQKMYEIANNIYKGLGDSRGIMVKQNIAQIHIIKKNYDEALIMLFESLQFARDLNDNLRYASILNEIGQIYDKQGNKDIALDKYKQCLKIIDQFGYLSIKPICLNNIGMIYKNQGNNEKALTYLIQSLRISEELRNLSEQTISLNNLGLIYIAQKNYEEALKYFTKYLKIAEKLGDIRKVDVLQKRIIEISQSIQNNSI